MAHILPCRPPMVTAHSSDSTLVNLDRCTFLHSWQRRNRPSQGSRSFDIGGHVEYIIILLLGIQKLLWGGLKAVKHPTMAHPVSTGGSDVLVGSIPVTTFDVP